MQIKTFIDEFLNEYISHRDCYDDITDLLDATIDNLVSLNTIDENKSIINDCCGDIFDAISLHNQYFPEDDINSEKSYFYERLAFVSMFVKIFPIIRHSINCFEWNEKLFIREFSMEFSGEMSNYENITDILDTTITEYVSMNSYKLNKEIIVNYYGSIENAIVAYICLIGELHYTTMDLIYRELAFISIFIHIYPKILSS